MDSNQRTLSGQIYSLVDLTTLPPLHRNTGDRCGRQFRRPASSGDCRCGRLGTGSIAAHASARNTLEVNTFSLGGRAVSRYATDMTKAPKSARNTSPRHREKAPARLWIYGRHAVAAAMENPERRVRRVLATKNAADWLKSRSPSPDGLAKIEDAKPDAIDRLLPTGAVHQGLAAEVFDLARARLKEACAPPEPHRPILVLDQITDPQNIGAIFRSAAAFGARAIIVQERRTPPLSGALAKAAAGAIETVPCVKVVNIARALEGLANLGYETVGLAGGGATPISTVPKTAPVALVLGAEGTGLRPLVAETCNQLVRIPITDAMESLNVSVAAAISLYEISRRDDARF